MHKTHTNHVWTVNYRRAERILKQMTRTLFFFLSLSHSLSAIYYHLKYEFVKLCDSQKFVVFMLFHFILNAYCKASVCPVDGFSENSLNDETECNYSWILNFSHKIFMCVTMSIPESCSWKSFRFLWRHLSDENIINKTIEKQLHIFFLLLLAGFQFNWNHIFGEGSESFRYGAQLCRSKFLHLAADMSSLACRRYYSNTRSFFTQFFFN